MQQGGRGQGGWWRCLGQGGEQHQRGHRACSSGTSRTGHTEPRCRGLRRQAWLVGPSRCQGEPISLPTQGSEGMVGVQGREREPRKGKGRGWRLEKVGMIMFLTLEVNEPIPSCPHLRIPGALCILTDRPCPPGSLVQRQLIKRPAPGCPWRVEWCQGWNQAEKTK